MHQNKIYQNWNVLKNVAKENVATLKILKLLVLKNSVQFKIRFKVINCYQFISYWDIEGMNFFLSFIFSSFKWQSSLLKIAKY